VQNDTITPSSGPGGADGVALGLWGVTKTYGRFTAVDDLSFEIPAGTICGFLGPNGAGKTTTLRMILDIIRPTRGTIRVLGSDSALKVRSRVGYLPEEKGLYKKMKVWTTIAYFASLKGMDRAGARRRAHELLDRYGLGPFADARTEALSKGMGQKLQVLAAIAHDPELVILDEPFAGLDPVNQAIMEQVIAELASRGRTVIFSTHVMQHAERICERIILINRGRKVFDGTIAEARGLLPRRVRLRTADGVASLRELPEVETMTPMPEAGSPEETAVAERSWELELGGTADPQTVLQACFARGIRLSAFELSEPTLHEAFVRMVGGDVGGGLPA